MTVSATAPEKKSALDSRTIFMIVAGLCLIALLYWFLVLFKGRQQRLQDLNTQLDTASTQLSDLQGKQSRLPAMRQEVEDLTQKQATFAAALPANKEMGEVVRSLRDNVKSSGGAITSVSSSASASNSGLPAGVKPIDITLMMTGDFPAVYRSLQAIETMRRFTKIRSAELNLTSDGSEQGTPKNVLNSTINMTTYTFDPTQVQPAAATDAPGSAPAPAAPAPASQGGQS